MYNGVAMLSSLPARADQAPGHQPVAKDTLRFFSAVSRKLVLFFGDISLDEIEPAHLYDWQSWLYGQNNIKVVTANSYSRTLRTMLNRVGRHDLAVALHFRPEPPPPAKTVTEEDYAAMLAVASVRDAAILLLLAESGCRRGAIPRLLLSDLKLWSGEDGRYRVACRTIQKGKYEGKEIVVFAGHKTGLAISLWLEVRPFDTSDHLFFSLKDGQPLEPNSITQILHRLKIRAGIPKDHQTNPHAFRHRFVQKKLAEGYDLKVISQWLGHSSVQTTADIYGRRTQEDLAHLFFREKPPPLEFNSHS